MRQLTPNDTRTVTAQDLVALSQDATAHPNALAYHLMRCSDGTLTSLAYQEHAPTPFFGVPAPLASAAYDEIDRRQSVNLALLSEIGRIRGVTLAL